MRRLLLISLLSMGSLVSFAADDPDLKKEKRFFEIYKQYNSAPTDDSTWEELAKGKTQAYSIQSGDTLWDLSETLFGDPYFWSKVWSINVDKIQNPHELSPGLSVIFNPGSTGDAPSLSLGARGQETEPVQEKETPLSSRENQELMSQAVIGPSKGKKVLKTLPPSFPSWDFGVIKQDLKFEVKHLNQNFGSPDSPLPFYISHQELPGAAVIGTEMGSDTASDFQYITVKLPNADAGQQFIAIKEIEDVKSKNASGRIVQVLGEIEVVEPIDREAGIYRALVKQTIHPLEVGARLVGGPLPLFNSSEESEGVASAQVITGAGDRQIFAAQNLIFLEGSGLQAGQVYPIYRIQKVKYDKSNSVDSPSQVGRVKVVHVSGEFATAVVLQSREEIRVGDLTSPHTKVQ